MWTSLGLGAASLIGGAMGSSASKKAAAQQAAAVDRATEEQSRQYSQTRADQAPFMRTGVAANERLAKLVGVDAGNGPVVWKGQEFKSADELRNILKADYARQTGHPSSAGNDAVIEGIIAQTTPGQSRADPSQEAGYGDLTRRFTEDDLNADPVYKSGLEFGLNQGRDAINARAVQAGGYDSGATLKALTRFGNDYGSTKANESYNRFTNDQNNIFNRLSGVSGTGQVATNQVNASGANMANNVSNLATEGGNARAAGIVGGANAWGNAVTGGANAANNYQQSEYLKKLLASRGSGSNQYASYGGQGLAQDDYSAGFY